MAAWDITSYIYSGKSLDVSGQSTSPTGVFFKADGLKIYIISSAPTDSVHEYALSTAWDVSTATFTDSLDVSSEETTPKDLYLDSTGARLYIVGPSSDSVGQYALSTAWDISTASFVRSFSLRFQELTPDGLYFKSDGTAMFVCGSTGNDVNEYSLSTAWDISTVSFVDAFSVSGQITQSPEAVVFNDDGSEMYVADRAGVIYQYTLSTAWDVSTATYTNSLDISALASDLNGLHFRGNGEKLYASDLGSDKVFQYQLPEVITATAAIAGTSTLVAIPSVISGIASIAGAGTLSGVGAAIPPAPSRAVDEASAGGTSAALSVSLNSAITEPANPSGNT